MVLMTPSGKENQTADATDRKYSRSPYQDQYYDSINNKKDTNPLNSSIYQKGNIETKRERGR
jgi:hypothetical protein